MEFAHLTLVFCSYNKHPYFTRFMINNKNYQTSLGEIDLNIPFNKYEKDIGKKVCEYKLSTEDRDFQFEGLFEIYLGENIGYCFIDNVGTTFEIMFIQKVEKLEYFLNCKYTSSILDAGNSRVEINLSLNKNRTKDRANLILINCLPNTSIKKNGQLFIDLEKVKTNIDSFSIKDNYQLCFYDDKCEDFSYKKIKIIEKLNFKSVYELYNKEVDNIVNNILDGINKSNKEVIKDALIEYRKKEYEYEHIIKRKYLYGKKILKEELNQEYYIDFIFKILFLIFVETNIEKENDIIIKNMNDLYNKFLENKKLICGDKLLETYEKIFLLIDIYFTEALDHSDYIIKYYHYKNFEKGSALFYAYEFLQDFIEKLDYDSKFYYPLLLNDGGNYNYKYVRDNCIRFVTIYGFNMLSLEEIKAHLREMLPNIIIFSNALNSDISAITNPLDGSIYLNNIQFKADQLIKKETDGNISKYAFIVSKLLVHELFGHKKSTYSKSEINYNSIISFKNELNELEFISRDDIYNWSIFKETNSIQTSEEINRYVGDSGYFIEYFFGKIENKYTLNLIDNVENRTNLNKLLDAELWHKDLETFKEYIKLKYIIVNYSPKIIINDKLNIKEQLKEMKFKLIEEKMLKDKKKMPDMSNIYVINNIINQLYEDCLKGFNIKNEGNREKKRTNITSTSKILLLNSTIYPK